MVAVERGKVLVTGANGYIAVWVVKYLLERGYSVRGTVRSESKAKHLKDLFSTYGDKLEIVIVPDITKVRPRAVGRDLPTVQSAMLTGGTVYAARSLRRMRQGR